MSDLSNSKTQSANMDGDYFFERDLNKSNLQDFYDSLPSHLQDKFKASLHAKINARNKLQGYRGPVEMCNGSSSDSGILEPSHGLKEIRFWWGFRKDANFVPLIGTGLYVLGRTRQHLAGELEWSSLYFDNKTGECLSHNKDEAAEKLNDIGRRFYKQGKYAEATNYHYNAYGACSPGYRKERKFKRDARKAEANARGSGRLRDRMTCRCS